jgi:hypothetical protein
MVQKERQQGKKVSSFRRDLAISKEDLPENSERSSRDGQESPRKMVEYYEKDSVDSNVDGDKIKKFSIPTPPSELSNRFNVSNPIGFGERPEINKTARRLSLPSIKLN